MSLEEGMSSVSTNNSWRIYDSVLGEIIRFIMCKVLSTNHNYRILRII